MPRHGHPPMQVLRALLQECEETLLGYERMPPKLLLSRTKWSPDRIRDYCAVCGRDALNHGADCAAADARTVPFSHVTRLGSYQEPLSAWIREIKFARWGCMAQQLGRLLGRACRQSIERGDQSPRCVVPVPMPSLRKHLRGIDHAQLLAREVARQTGLPLRRCVRQKHGPTQVSGPSGRRRRRPNPFRPAAWGKRAKGKNILLVDDVLTSGSTARDVCRVLRSLGAREISLAVLAVVDDR
ncbi:MAG: phosphoribosyltransferase family protein [Planctomycetota bacterium]|nr:phosphoribosyltransferase family protein [Planctomycetota bacterium]